jgi:hypothetical protein
MKCPLSAICKGVQDMITTTIIKGDVATLELASGEKVVGMIKNISPDSETVVLASAETGKDLTVSFDEISAGAVEFRPPQNVAAKFIPFAIAVGVIEAVAGAVAGVVEEPLFR